MPGLIYSKGYFPFPIIDAPLWDNATFFHLPVFDDTESNREGTLLLPGLTGPQTTTGVFPLSSLPNQYQDGTPLLQYKPVVGPGTLYPVGMSLDSATRIFWRVKRWKFTSTWNKTFTNPDGSGSGDFSIGNTFSGNFGVASDDPIVLLPNNATLNGNPRDMEVAAPAFARIYPQSFSLSAAIFGTGDEGISNAAFLLNNNPATYDSLQFFISGKLWVDILLQGSTGGPGELQNICFEKTTGLYYPALCFGGSFLLYDVNTDPYPPFTPISIKTQYISGTGGLSSDLVGGDLSFVEDSLKFTYSATFLSKADVGLALSENTVVEPLEWFPYDPGDGGGPYYDTTTGEQIRVNG